jgi:hypothetical protein
MDNQITAMGSNVTAVSGGVNMLSTQVTALQNTTTMLPQLVAHAFLSFSALPSEKWQVTEFPISLLTFVQWIW